jgi:thiol-disulfide isomerase/thioredoxin
VRRLALAAVLALGRAFALAGAFALGGCGGASPGAAAPRSLPAHLPPGARLVDPATGPFDAAARYRGHVVVLDFWAGWCDECVRAVPAVGRLAQAFAADGLVVVGVDAGDKPADAAAYVRSLHIAYPVALDPDLVLSDRIGASELPMLLVLDRHGSIAYRTRHIDAQLLATVRTLLHAR